MKRTTLVEYDEASPGVQRIYDEIMETLGTPDVLNVFKALGNNENALTGVWGMLKATLVKGEIPSLLKELILFRISIKAGNEYCTSLHAHNACNLDSNLSYDDLMSLAEGQANAKLPAAFQVAMEVVSRSALDSKSVADDSFELEEELRDAGFSEAEIDELLSIGYFSVMMNSLVDSYELPWEAPFPPEDAHSNAQ
jgi:alkylhydroperoxidase family enzyme